MLMMMIQSPAPAEAWDRLMQSRCRRRRGGRLGHGRTPTRPGGGSLQEQKLSSVLGGDAGVPKACAPLSPGASGSTKTKCQFTVKC